MKEKGREPKLVFYFVAPPVIMPVSLRYDNSEYMWFRSIINFPHNDPISKYVVENMYLLDTFTLNEHQVVRCFSKKVVRHDEIMSRPALSNPGEPLTAQAIQRAVWPGA